MILFALASAVTGAAPSVPVLLLGRVLQGVGGALVAPQALSLITATFPPERLGGALGIFGAVMGLSSIVGPTAGGLIVSHVSWRWVFFANIPFVVVAIFAMLRLAPDVRPIKTQRLDAVSVLLSTAALGAVLFGIIEGERFRWGPVWGDLTILRIMLFGGLLFLAFVAWERRTSDPLVPASLFRTPRFLAMAWVGVAVEFALQGSLVGFGVCFQTALEMTPFEAALAFLPLTVAGGLMTAPAGRLIDRHLEKVALGGGLVAFAAGIAGIAAITRGHSSPLAFAPAMIVAGLGVGCLIAPVSALGLRHVDRSRVGTAAGVLNTVRELAGVLGTAVVGALVQHGLMRELRAKLAEEPGPDRACLEATLTAHGQGVGMGVAKRYLPPECTEEAARQAQHVFSRAYVSSLGIVVALIAGLLLVAAVSVFAQRRPQEDIAQ
jgi:EmrB/QacA subfamily drug resistance transporter